MIEEVNKIIYNMLISGRGVNLPGLGVLYIERQAARKLSDGRLLGPRNVVVFSKQEPAPSLVDEIVSIASCAVEQAQDIYERWTAKTYQEGVLTIGGVGVLKNGVFSTDKAFLSAINPQGIKTIVVRKRRRASNGWLYAVTGIAVVVALGFLAFLMWGDTLTGKAKSAEKVAVAEVVAAETPAVEGEQVAEEQAPEQTAEQPAMQSAAPQAVANSGSYAYYVVVGIFSTPENAARAVEQTRSKMKDVACEVLPFKGKHMVTVFGSDKREDCNAFARSYRDIYPDLWVYNKQ